VGIATIECDEKFSDRHDLGPAENEALDCFAGARNDEPFSRRAFFPLPPRARWGGVGFRGAGVGWRGAGLGWRAAAWRRGGGLARTRLGMGRSRTWARIGRRRHLAVAVRLLWKRLFVLRLWLRLSVLRSRLRIPGLRLVWLGGRLGRVKICRSRRAFFPLPRGRDGEGRRVSRREMSRGEGRANRTLIPAAVTDRPARRTGRRSGPRPWRRSRRSSRHAGR
jgi:hypothetical protein